MRRLLRDKEMEADLEASAMEPGPMLGGYTRLAFSTQTPYVLHLMRDPVPFLWWHEWTCSPGNEAGSRTKKPAEPWECFSRFCALYDASDEAIVGFAARYGILGIWPCQRQFCVTGLSLYDRQTLYSHSYRDLPSESSSARARHRAQLTEEESYSNEIVYSVESNYTWVGEPINLWRWLAWHLRYLARIGASLHRGELAPESDWAEVLLPGEINVKRYMLGDEGPECLPQLVTQRYEFTDLINRWLPNVAAQLALRQQPDGKLGVHLEADYFERTWQRPDYERCEARGYAWSDLRADSGWNRDGLTDLETRPSLLLNLLILQLTAIITSGAAVCCRCGGPAPAHSPRGKRLPITKTYCGEACKAEARKETKRNSWHKAKQKEAEGSHAEAVSETVLG